MSTNVEGQSVSPNDAKPIVSGSVYQINTLEDLCNAANKDNYERLGVDLLQWFIGYVETIDAIRKKYPTETLGKKNTEIARGGFEWHDDGKNEFLGIDVIDEKNNKTESYRV